MASRAGAPEVDEAEADFFGDLGDALGLAAAGRGLDVEVETLGTRDTGLGQLGLLANHTLELGNLHG